ncbi:MAG: hypothetical protein JWO82_1388, partial [Akkermansiaceae bacterium]|nr:hypothetical protein [Akkermansiaceae bacterium]
ISKRFKLSFDEKSGIAERWHAMKLQLSFALLALAGSLGTALSQTTVDSSSYPGLFGPDDTVTADVDAGGLLGITLAGSTTDSLGTYWNATATGGAALAVLFLPVVKSQAQVALASSTLQFKINNDPGSILGALGVGTGLSLSWSATATLNKSGSVFQLQPNSTYRVGFDVDTGSQLLSTTLNITPSFGVTFLDANNNAIGSSGGTTLVNILGLQLLGVIGSPSTGHAVVDFKTGASVPVGAAKVKFTGGSILPASLLGIGTTFATVSNLSVSYVSPFQEWIEHSGITNPADQDPNADPDHDGRNNLSEFAVDSNPAVSDNNNVHVAVGDPDGDGPETSTVVMTLPVRNGTEFTGTGTAQTGAVDGVSYRIEGSFDLVNWALAISEVTSNASFVAGLPELHAGWSYRSFRIPGQTADTPRAFLRAKLN